MSTLRNRSLGPNCSTYQFFGHSGRPRASSVPRAISISTVRSQHDYEVVSTKHIHSASGHSKPPSLPPAACSFGFDTAVISGAEENLPSCTLSSLGEGTIVAIATIGTICGAIVAGNPPTAFT